jgi:hypothetical protein
MASSTTAPSAIHRQDKTIGSLALSPGSVRHSISSWLPSLTRRVNCVNLDSSTCQNVNIYFTQGRKHFDYLPTSGWQQLPNKIVTRWWRCIFNRLVSTVDFYSPFLLVTKERFLIDAMTSDERDSFSSPQLAIRVRVECVGGNPRWAIDLFESFVLI